MKSRVRGIIVPDVCLHALLADLEAFFESNPLCQIILVLASIIPVTSKRQLSAISSILGFNNSLNTVLVILSKTSNLNLALTFLTTKPLEQNTVYAKSNGLDLNAWFGLTQTTESMVWFVQTTANGLSNGLQSVWTVWLNTIESSNLFSKAPIHSLSIPA